MRPRIVVVSTVLFAFAILPIVVLESYGSHYDHFGITLSKTCTTMLKNNITTTCPTYEELLTVYPDTSNKIISGDFEFKDGLYQRNMGMAKSNHVEFYKYNTETVMWIDPPSDIMARTQMIIIEPTLPEYKITGVSGTIINGTLSTGHDRWINPNCSEIVVSSTDWLLLVGDTLNLLNHDCDMEYSNYNHIKEKVFEKTEMDITTSYKYQLAQWVDQAKKDCLTLCREY